MRKSIQTFQRRNTLKYMPGWTPEQVKVPRNVKVVAHNSVNELVLIISCMIYSKTGVFSPAHGLLLSCKV